MSQRVGGRGAGNQQEKENHQQLDSDQTQSGLDHESKKNQTCPYRVRNSSPMKPREKIRQADDSDSSDDRKQGTQQN